MIRRNSSVVVLKDFELLPQGEGNIDAEVRVKEQLGGESLLYLKTIEDTETISDIVVSVSGDDMTNIGDQVGLHIPSHRLHQFDAEGYAL